MARAKPEKMRAKQMEARELLQAARAQGEAAFAALAARGNWAMRDVLDGVHLQPGVTPWECTPDERAAVDQAREERRSKEGDGGTGTLKAPAGGLSKAEKKQERRRARQLQAREQLYRARCQGLEAFAERAARGNWAVRNVLDGVNLERGIVPWKWTGDERAAVASHREAERAKERAMLAEYAAQGHVADKETDSRWIAYLLKHGWSGNRYATAVARALEDPARAYPTWFRSAVAALKANAAAGQSTWAIVEDGGTLEYEDVQTVLNEHRRNMEFEGLATGVSVAHSSTQDAAQSASSDCG